MSDVSLKMTYALKDGVITHISKVESGLACGCVCPACGEKLIAKKGNIVKHLIILIIPPFIIYVNI